MAEDITEVAGGASAAVASEIALVPDIFYAIALGLCLGAAEMMGRYRDEPTKIFQATAAWYYLGVNGALAAISLYLIREFGLSFIPETTGGPEIRDTTQAARIYDVLLAGFGGAAFFRSSIMKTKIGDADVSIGPAIVIDTLLKVTDREVDRFRAEQRARRISPLMKGVSLREAIDVVVPFCTALMQNLNAAEREALRKDARSIASETSVDSATKPMLVGLMLVGLVGFGVLEQAIKILRDQDLIGVEQKAEGKKKSSLLARVSKSFSSRRGSQGDGQDETEETSGPAPKEPPEGGAGKAPEPPDADVGGGGDDAPTDEGDPSKPG
jgi:hypothetical protein